MAMVLAPSSRPRPSGVAPRRFSTQVLALEAGGDGQVDHGGGHDGEGEDAGGQEGDGSSPSMGSTSTVEKKTSSPTGMPRVSRSDSPRRRVSVVSTRAWARRAVAPLMAPPPG